MDTTTSPRPRRGIVKRFFAVAGAAVLLAVVGCTAASDDTPTGTAQSAIDWTNCGDGLECATIPVPLDWDEPDGEKIELAVIKHSASKPEERIGTIFTDPGGPGDTGVGLIKGAGDDLDAWSDGRFDWIGWDPRGTHASSPIDCFETPADADEFWAGIRLPSTPEESAAFAVHSKELALRCGEVMGDLLSHVSTVDTVRDLDHMRELIGEDKITYVGLSYGTVIGQVYANMYPEHLRAMLLDGLVNVVAYSTSAEVRAADGASSADEVFDQFIATCEEAGAGKCALAGHGEPVADRLDRLFEFARQGLPAPNADPPEDLAYNDLVMSSFAALRNPALWPAWAEQLEAAVQGDASTLATAAAAARTTAMWTEATKSSAISCLDAPAEKSVDDWPEVIGEFTELSRMGGAIQGWWLWAPCASEWPASSDDRLEGPWDAQTEVPVLLINNRYDPNTSWASAAATEKLLGNAVLLTNEGYGHPTFQDPSTCVDEWRVRYLVDLETPPPGTTCESDVKPFSTAVE
jgi:pimeloyl-ACP methyl ester carboxylesterase